MKVHLKWVFALPEAEPHKDPVLLELKFSKVTPTPL